MPAEHHPVAGVVVFMRPDDFGDVVPQSARLQMRGRLLAFAALAAIREPLFDHRDVHGYQNVTVVVIMPRLTVIRRVSRRIRFRRQRPSPTACSGSSQAWFTHRKLIRNSVPVNGSANTPPAL